MELINCPVCDSNDSSLYIKLKDRFKTNNETFSLVQCKCAFVYLSPRPNENTISKFYKNNDYSPHAETSLFYKIAQKISFRWKLKIISKYSINYNKPFILDYGSGKGEFADYLIKKSFDIDKYDPIFTDKSTKMYSDSNQINKQYNIITLWHSLEHVHRLNQTLDKIYQLLSDKGVLLIAVPNINASEKQYFRDKWVAYDAPRHLYHFSSETMLKFLNKHGLEMIELKPIYQDTFYNTYLSLSSKYFLIKLIKTCYISIISFLKILFSNKQKSSSLLYICIKK